MVSVRVLFPYPNHLLTSFFRVAKDNKGAPAVLELTASNRGLEHYQVVVVTGDLPNSGSDSNISFVAFGDKVLLHVTNFLLLQTHVIIIGRQWSQET